MYSHAESFVLGPLSWRLHPGTFILGSSSCHWQLDYDWHRPFKSLTAPWVWICMAVWERHTWHSLLMLSRMNEGLYCCNRLNVCRPDGFIVPAFTRRFLFADSSICHLSPQSAFCDLHQESHGDKTTHMQLNRRRYWWQLASLVLIGYLGSAVNSLNKYTYQI